MNVLLVHNFYQQAGGEDQVFAEEAALLEKHGNTVARFTMDNDSVEGMGKLALAGKTFWNRDAQASISSAIREIRADVVHFHNTFPLVSPAAYYASHDAGAAVVQTLHNYRLMCPTATFYRDGGVCENCLGKLLAWPGVVHKCYRQNRGATAVVAGMLAFHKLRGTYANQVDRYIALTEFARQKLVQGGVPAERIRVKPNFVDPDPGLGDGGGDFALFVGRLTEEKGILTLIKAWPDLFARRGYKLHIAGDGPLKQAVVDASAACSGIIYEGRKPPAEIYAMMGAARALIFPSQWYEGLPRTIVESYAKGTPVLASRMGSMQELVHDGQTGVLFEPGDARDLARQAERLLSVDPSTVELRARMRSAARAEFESHYRAERNYPLLMEIYEQAVAQSHGSGSPRTVASGISGHPM
jgi:glycosyltransferase involved in cell wall biosynthesis